MVLADPVRLSIDHQFDLSRNKAMPRNVWEIPINDETSEEDLELCANAAERTSDSNVQRAAAKARAQMRRRQEESELSQARTRITELENELSQARGELSGQRGGSVWLRWQTISGWLVAILMIVTLVVEGGAI